MLAARARALVDGRLSPSLDDIATLAEPALKHRMALSFAARAEGETISAAIDGLWPRRSNDVVASGVMTLPASIRRDAATLSARLPSLVIAARRVAQTVRHGVHGRRRAGSGEQSGSFGPFFPVSRRRASTGVVPLARSALSSASANGKRRIPFGYGSIARL